MGINRTVSVTNVDMDACPIRFISVGKLGDTTNLDKSLLNASKHIFCTLLICSVYIFDTTYIKISSYNFSHICRPTIDLRDAKSMASFELLSPYHNAISLVTIASHNSPKFGTNFMASVFFFVLFVVVTVVVSALLKQVSCKADTIFWYCCCATGRNRFDAVHCCGCSTK